MTENQRPKSSVSSITGIIGAITFALSSFGLKLFMPDLNIYTDCLLILTFTAVAMVFYDSIVVKEYLSPDNGLDWSLYAIKFKTIFFETDFYIRFLGFAISLIPLFLIYPILDLHGDMLDPFFNFIGINIFLFAGVYIAYLVLIYPALKVTKDGMWALGAYIFPKLRKDIVQGELKDYLLSVAIKIFFLPLMFVFFFQGWEAIKFGQFKFDNAHQIFSLMFNSLFFLDVGFALIGYVFSMRLLNSHIRWSERTWGGWFFCLICYFPLNVIFFDKFLNYHDGLTWNDWIGDYPVLYIMWGIVLLIGHVIYVAATVNFGLRFSNLTHRGIITHGMYAYTKHPAYISKNLAWWLMEIPFMATSFGLAIKNIILISLVNLVYFARAKYEEKMLMADGNYRDYADYIDKNGLFSKLRK